MTTKQDVYLKLLKQIREEAGLSQAQLGKILGKSQSLISRYETGTRKSDVVILSMICKSVGITLFDFVQRYLELIGE